MSVNENLLVKALTFSPMRIVDDKSCLILCFVIAFLHAIHSMHIADGVNVVVFSFSM